MREPETTSDVVRDGPTAMTVTDLLALAPMRRARPEVLVPGERTISWVHSSEIYEIAPLLGGGEVLLTTGLGLVGRDDDELARYAVDVAARGAAALVLELGRTFLRVPDALVRACRGTGMCLVVLHTVVPFVRIARVANERILDHEATGLRRASALATRLSALLLRRAPLGDLVAAVADATGAVVHLVDAEGRLLAGRDRLEGRTRHVDIEVSGSPAGRLVAAAGDEHLDRLLAASVDALQLALTEMGALRRRDAARTLLLDLVHGPVLDPDEVARRAAAVGLVARRPVTVLLFELAHPRPDAAPAAIRRVLHERVRTDLLVVQDHEVIAVVDDGAATRATAAALLAAVDAALVVDGGTGRVRHLAVGPVVPQLDRVPGSFAVARAAADTADRLGSPRRLLLPADLALERLLLASDDAALERFVARVLGPLVQHDATRRTRLLPTLLAYLACGRSKAATAAQLGVRRQTVHERLDRIGRMLDLAVDDPAATTALEVATLAWQLRGAGLGDARTDGGGVVGPAATQERTSHPA